LQTKVILNNLIDSYNTGVIVKPTGEETVGTDKQESGQQGKAS
jgi:hypothetical protein